MSNRDKDQKIYTHIEHPFAPIWDAKSRILILGTLPSPKSRQYGFYYGHPANRFWATLAQALGVAEPETDKASKEAFLLLNHIALWDVLQSCQIQGASDSSIRNPIPNKFHDIITKSDIHTVFTTGNKATTLFNRLSAAEAGMTARYLPSTSPANVCWYKRNDYAVWEREIRSTVITGSNR